MSALNGKKLKYATLHYPLFVPGLGTIGPTLSNDNSATHKAIEMIVDEPFVSLKGTTNGKSYTMYIPLTSFTHMVLDKE